MSDKITPVDLKSFYRNCYKGSDLQKINSNNPLPHKCTIKGQEFYYYNADLSGLMWLQGNDRRLKYNDFIDVYRKGFSEGLKHLQEQEGIKRRDYNNPEQRELLRRDLTHFVYKREFIPNHKGLQALMSRTILRWTEDNIYLQGYYNGLLHSIVSLNKDLNLNIGFPETSNDNNVKTPSKAGRRKTEIKPAIAYLKGFTLPENKTKFLAELKELYKGAEPKTFNYIIGALEVLNFIKVESNKAIKEAFEKEIEPKEQSQTNFDNNYRDGFPDEKLLESLKKEIESIRNSKQLF